MSTKHRNAGGPFVIFEPGLGISGSLEIDGTIGGRVGKNEGVQIATNTFITGTLKVGADRYMSLSNNEIDVSNGDLTLDVAGNVEINADGGTITFKDGASSLSTITSAGFSGDISGNATTATTATVSTTVTVSDNESTNEDNKIIFGAGAAGSGNIGLEADGDLTYNPSSGTVATKALRLTKDSGIYTPQIHIHEVDSDGYGRIGFTNTSDTNGGFGSYSHEWAIAGKPAAQASQSTAVLNIWYGDADGDGSGADILSVRGDKKVGINDSSPSYALDVNGQVRATSGYIGDVTGNASTATALATGRSLKVDLTSTSASTAFDGTGALTDIGVNGSLPLANGGTGASDASGARSNLGLGTLATQGAINTTDFTSNSLVTESDGIASNDNDTSVPTSAAVKAYADSVGGGSSFSYLQEAGSPSGNSKILIANNGATFPSSTVKEASLVIKSNTNSGSPGTGGAAIAIHDDGSNAGWQIYYDTGDGNLMFVTDGIATGYQMLDSISGTNTISTSFTGQHRCLPGSGSLNDYKNYVGLIIETTGEYRNFETDSIVDKPSIDQAVPKIKLTTDRNSKKVFGIVSGIEEQPLRQVHFSMSRQWEIPDSDRRVLVNSIGEGGIWICNINGSLENGDYITACEVPGLGMKQSDDLLHNYTVAKITCDCDFNLGSTVYDCEEFEFNGHTYKKAFVGCTYHCG